jgi:pyruvate dehydrogenase E1 component
VPNCRAYDPCFAYELAVIVEDGMRRMLVAQEDVFFYVTVMNENYAQPSAPADAAVAAGILRGLYKVRATSRGPAKVRLLGAGTILREALAAAELLETAHGVAADVYSVTSFTELRRTAMEVERARRLGGGVGDSATATWVETQLPADGTPVVAASDYVAAVADLIRPWVHDRYVTLGTDGFGRSDTRAALRRFFEVDRHAIAVAALSTLDPARAAAAAHDYGLDAAAPPPWTR